MLTRSSLLSLSSLVIFLTFALGQAKTDCPSSVNSTVQKVYPDAKVSSCKQEKEDGKVQYEVLLTTKDAKKLELDISPEGALIQTEEKIMVDSIPKIVMSAFAGKYPKMKIGRAEKQTKDTGVVMYELAFKDNGKKYEVTFGADGKFVEEE